VEVNATSAAPCAVTAMAARQWEAVDNAF